MNNYAEQALEADSTPLRPISSLQPKVIVPVASPDPALSSSSANTSTPGPPSQASGDEPPTFRRRIRLRPPRKTGVTTNTEVAVQADVYYHVPTEAEVAHKYHLRELAIKSGYARKPYLFDISDLAIFDAVVNAANLKSAQPKPVRIGRKRKRSRESGSKMDENHVPARSKKPKLRIGVASSSSTNTTPPHAQDLKLTVMKPKVTLPHLSCCVQ